MAIKIFILFSIVFLTLFLVSMVYGLNAEVNGSVQVGKNNNSNNSENKTQPSNSNNESRGIGQELNGIVRVKISALKEGDYKISLGQELNVKQISADLRELRVDGVSAKTRLNITSEEKDDETILKAHLSNGKESEIKIMPNRASEVAIARLKLKVCSEENNCTIELKEVGNNNEIKVAYNVKAEKEVKILGLFRAKMNVETNVDASTGVIISSKVPWWYSISID